MLYRLRKDFAEAMTNVRPDKLKVEFEAIHTCDFYHSDAAPHGWWPDTGRWDPRKILETQYPKESVLGFADRGYRNQEELVTRILEGGYNCEESSDLGGFVCISGGSEADFPVGSVDHEIGLQFGFCHQRTRLDLDKQVGSFTKFQARMQCHGDREEARKLLEKLTENEVTLARRSFSTEAAETISLDYLRFLTIHRKFHSFRIDHFIHYQMRDYLKGYVVGMLQKRHELRKRPGYELMSSLLKLLVRSQVL